MPDFAIIIHKILNVRISPVIYMMVLASVIIGFFFATGFLVGNTESVLYSSGVLLNKQIWGGILLISSILSLYGLRSRRKEIMTTASSVSAMLWMFACISLLIQAHFYVLFGVYLVHLLCHIYIYLASSLGYLERTCSTSNI